MEIFLQAVCPVIWSQRCTPRVQRQPRLSTALKRPDLAEHRATNAIRYRVVVGGQPSGNGGEDLRRLGAVVLRACGLGEAVHIGLGDVVHPRVAEHPADRIRRGTAKQAGRVRRRRGQPDLGTDHRKLGNVWRTAESNYGSSPYHRVPIDFPARDFGERPDQRLYFSSVGPGSGRFALDATSQIPPNRL